VTNDDKSNLLITVDGMDYLETNPPTPEMVMPLIRAVGLASPPPQPVTATLAASATPPVAPTSPAAAAGTPLTPTGALNLKRIREALAR
jgi:hypothetical protein